MQEVKKIVVLGPESTGKSTLCQQLASHYNTLWCREYAREYLLEHGINYSFDDLLVIAKGQLALEDYYVSAMNKKPKVNKRQATEQPPATTHQLLFLDTNMHVMQVWCEFVFGKCHQAIIDEIVERKYDLYLLCNTDLPWVKDELREYPDLKTRDELYHIYKDILVNQPVPWVNVYGNNEERKEVAIIAIDRLLAG